MKLSIIIPIYNGARYLPRCLDSVLASPISDMECILVNDGSTDSTDSICRSYVAKDSRFVYLQRDNGGVSAARNSGLVHARGTYIMFIDADDYYTSEAWRIISETLQNSVADFMVFSYYTLFEDGNMQLQAFDLLGDSSRDLRLLRDWVYTTSLMNTCWGKIFRYDLIRKNKLKFQTELPIGEDYLFVATYFQYCESVYVSNQPILYYFQRTGSAMRSYSLIQRVGFMEQLYQQSLPQVLSIGEEDLLRRFYQYYVKVITNLLLVFAKDASPKERKHLFHEIFRNQTVCEILEKATVKGFSPIYKKIELWLLKKQKTWWLSVYFGIKVRKFTSPKQYMK